MRPFRNLTDQIADKSSKKQLLAECQMIRGSWGDEKVPIGNDEDFSAAHDILVEERSKVGNATEDYEVPGDFILDRHTGDRSWIGVVCDRYSARVILAVRAAQVRFPQAFPVVLDCDEAEITVTPDGRVFGVTADVGGEKLLARFGFPNKN